MRNVRSLLGGFVIAMAFGGVALAASDPPKEPSVPINTCNTCPLLLPPWACRIYCG